MQELIVILIDGLVFSSYLFMVAVGMTVIFGVMKILNVTHGSFYAFGAYMSATLIGAYYQTDWHEFGGFLAIFAAAIIIGVVLGIIIERGVLKFLYDKDEHLIVLATFALFLVLEDVLLLIWGTDPYFAFEPMGLLGAVDIVEMTFDVYSLTLIGLAAIVGISLWLGLTRTKWGKLLLAVIYDREISQAMGINVAVVFTVTFVIGAMLGALGGAYIAPTISVNPGIGVEVTVLAFAVVVIGGMGSIPGAMIGALLVGISRAVAVHKFPEIELFVIYAIMAGVLALRPEGLFAPAKVRKI
ncbi:MAG: branched-chain amino acid ABC transporter permease [Alphaproteobacteria bacterium]|nr:branched-chain amino acid ABC transporter permease [Alphaproteobacteria bacterium]MBT4018271.1 branched-chain amino acid ABC transporter permease [Alphaproteobacteria bacterium]MBT4542347.1 branched-chain amino acid ABC transporter permease [Alphaproteobacteria bacterium]MBT5161283.1 branched-chain amino acid ABC transporter permease [Alphaproteobacteria bacterium]MBT5917785.1 branched-chain amino acid ABC transporter permease [Alphaproteobacteria bacterium]